MSNPNRDGTNFQRRDSEMNRRGLLRRRTSTGLILLVAVLVACQDENLRGKSEATTRSDKTVNAESRGPSSMNSQLATQATTADEIVNTNNKKNESSPSIQITDVPSSGAGEVELKTIGGKVSGVKGSECKVVVFAHTNTWYVQPYVDSSDISIRDDNTWRSDTHLGYEYAALLVKASYSPPSTTGKLPEVGGQVLAIDRASAKK
jgi:hypothetical protein